MAKKTKKKRTNKGIVLIKKANNLIESRYKFDIWETRVFVSVLAQIRREDKDLQVYRIWFKDVIRDFELKSSRSYGLLREGASSLMDKSFFVNYEKNGRIREKKYHIIRKLDYLKKGQEGGGGAEDHEYIDVTIEEDMKPLLLQLKGNFTSYDQRNIKRLAPYSYRVYELLKQYQTIGKRTLEVERMKVMFEVTEQYKLFADFYRWIVKPAVKEIDAHSDLIITKVEKIKEGRRVVALCFTFRVKTVEELAKARGEAIQPELFDPPKKVKKEPPTEIKETEKDRLFGEYYEQVQKFGITPSTFLELLDTYNEKQIVQAIGVTTRAKQKDQIKTSVGGFFIKALKEGYKDVQQEVKEKKLKSEVLEAKQKEIQERLIALQEEKSKRINKRIEELAREEPQVISEAITVLRQSDAGGVLLRKKEKELGREMNFEEFRSNRMFSGFLRAKILESAEDRFATIEEEFSIKEQELKKVKGE